MNLYVKRLAHFRNCAIISRNNLHSRVYNWKEARKPFLYFNFCVILRNTFLSSQSSPSIFFIYFTDIINDYTQPPKNITFFCSFKKQLVWNILSKRIPNISFSFSSMSSSFWEIKKFITSLILIHIAAINLSKQTFSPILVINYPKYYWSYLLLP